MILPPTSGVVALWQLAIEPNDRRFWFINPLPLGILNRHNPIRIIRDGLSLLRIRNELSLPIPPRKPLIVRISITYIRVILSPIRSGLLFMLRVLGVILALGNMQSVVGFLVVQLDLRWLMEDVVQLLDAGLWQLHL